MTRRGDDSPYESRTGAWTASRLTHKFIPGHIPSFTVYLQPATVQFEPVRDLGQISMARAREIARNDFPALETYVLRAADYALRVMNDKLDTTARRDKMAQHLLQLPIPIIRYKGAKESQQDKVAALTDSRFERPRVPQGDNQFVEPRTPTPKIDIRSIAA